MSTVFFQRQTQYQAVATCPFPIAPPVPRITESVFIDYFYRQFPPVLLEGLYGSDIPALKTWGLDAGKAPWRPSFPDLVPGARPLVPEGFFAYVNRTPPPFTGPPWVSYPECAPGFVQPAEMFRLGYVSAIKRWGLDSGESPWRFVFPDLVPGFRPLVSEGFYAYVNRTPPPFAVPPKGSYPDQVPGPRPVVPEGFYAYVNRTPPPFVVPPSASYPERAPGSRPLVPEGFYAYVNRTPVPFTAPPWSCYPPSAPGPRPLVEWAQIGYVPALKAWGLDGGKTPWRGSFPEMVPGPRPLVAEGFIGYVNRTPPPFAVPPSSVYVDQAPGPRPLVPEGRVAVVLDVALPFTTSPLVCIPARAPGPLPLVEPTFVGYVPAVKTWGIDAGKIPWRGFAPDQSPGPRPLVPEGAFAFVNRTPVPFVAPPFVSCPDQAPGPRPLAPEGAFSYLNPTPPPFTAPSWSCFPAQAPAALPLVPEGAFSYVDATPPPFTTSPLVSIPAQVLGAQRTVEYQAAAYVPALRTWGIDAGKIPWHSQTPDIVRRIEVQTAQQASVLGIVTPFVAQVLSTPAPPITVAFAPYTAFYPAPFVPPRPILFVSVQAPDPIASVFAAFGRRSADVLLVEPPIQFVPSYAPVALPVSGVGPWLWPFAAIPVQLGTIVVFVPPLHLQGVVSPLSTLAGVVASLGVLAGQVESVGGDVHGTIAALGAFLAEVFKL